MFTWPAFPPDPAACQPLTIAAMRVTISLQYSLFSCTRTFKARLCVRGPLGLGTVP
jgi:hypothetical protein